MALYFVGLDVHLRTSTMVMLDSGGQRVAERTIRGHWSKMIDWLAQRRRPMAICFEASCGYGVIYERLAAIAITQADISGTSGTRSRTSTGAIRLKQTWQA